MRLFARFVTSGGIAIGACVLGMQGQTAAQELPDPSALLGTAAERTTRVGPSPEA